jgi:hypothetical protein
LNREIPLIRAEFVASADKGAMLHQGKFIMLYTIAVVLIILWLLGFIGHIGGGLIHLLLVIAVVLVIVNLISGRRGL